MFFILFYNVESLNETTDVRWFVTWEDKIAFDGAKCQIAKIMAPPMWMLL